LANNGLKTFRQQAGYIYTVKTIQEVHCVLFISLRKSLRT